MKNNCKSVSKTDEASGDSLSPKRVLITKELVKLKAQQNIKRVWKT